MKNKLFIVYALIFLCYGAQLSGQVTQQLLQQQLLERGIDEAQFRIKLQQRGVMYESLDDVPPEKYGEIEPIVKQIIEEMEREKAAIKTTNQIEQTGIEPAKEDPLEAPVREVKESILEGATIEEAVAETIEDKKPNLPPAKIYGQDIFRNQTLKVFRQADNIKPKDNYLLGPGDELTISIWGVSIFERTYTIDDGGYISPAAMPRIYLKDLTFTAAKEKLLRNFAAFNRFSPDQFEVSLRFARTISLGIFGEVFDPGNHTISAINSAFNALVAAGGPTDIGTLRNIKWIKSSGSVEKIDVYEYMVDPTIADNFYLSENDIIQVPIAERIIGIAGAVTRPMRYELVEGEELLKLLEYAGGFKPEAYKEIIQLKRYENDLQKVIDIDFNNLINRKGDFTLKNGDQLVVRTIPSPYRNFASIVGSVELPGEYEFQESMRVSDLLERALLTDESERSFAVLRRTNRNGTSNFIRIELAEILSNPASSANVLIAPNDQLQIYNKGSFIDQYQVSVAGQVRAPGSFAYDPSENMRVRDIVLMAGGLSPDATDFAYVIRRDLETGEPEYISISIKEAISDATSNQNLVLQQGDELRIQSQRSFIEDATISIGGAVRLPGSFDYDQAMTVKDLLTLANGLRIDAATNRVEISRMVIEQNTPTKVIIATLSIDPDLNPSGNPTFQLEPYDRVYVRSVPEFEFQREVNIQGEVKYPGPYTIISDNERLTSLVRRAGGLTEEAFPSGALLMRTFDATGPIVIELDKVLANEGSEANIILKEGDVVTVPKIKDFVAIAGAVNTTRLYRTDLIGPDNRVTVIFDGSRSARYYIENFAGGFADNGDRKKVTVEYPNGKIKEAKDYGLFKSYPKVEKGAIVRVGVKDIDPDRPLTPKEPIDWGDVLANAVGQATAVLTLILLIDRAGR